MATGTVPLPAPNWSPPDGSTSNLVPQWAMRKGTNGPPARFVPVWIFTKQVAAANAITNLWTNFPLPANYASGGTLRILGACGTAGAGNVRWQCSVGFQAVTASDSFLAHAQATASAATGSVPATTANRPFEVSISPSMDSAASGGDVYVLLQRLGTDAADTCTADIVFIRAAFDYTTT